MLTLRAIAGQLSLLALGISLGAAGPDPAPTEVAAQIGSTTLTVADVQSMLAHLDPTVRDQLLHNRSALADLVRNQLLRQELLNEAKAKKWDQDPDVGYRANQAHDTVVADSYLASLTQPDAAYPSDADVQTMYDANKSRFVKPREFRLAQISISVPADASKAVDDDAKKRLHDLKLTLSAPHADFADAAKRLSQDKASADKGGEIGWAREDQLVPAIKDVVVGMQENAISDPIRAPDGWHLVKLLEVKPSAPASLAEAKDTIVRSMRQERAAENARTYLQQMQVKDPLELNEIALPHVTAH